VPVTLFVLRIVGRIDVGYGPRPDAVNLPDGFLARPHEVVYPQSRLLSNKVRTFVDECVGKLRSLKFD
jgi:hypothetical protein